MKNLSVNLKPQDLNFEDASATLAKFRITAQDRNASHSFYPTIELCDDEGVWGAIYCQPSIRAGSFHRTELNHIWIATALPELSKSGQLARFVMDPTFFHACPARRSSYSTELIFREAYRTTLFDHAFKKVSERQGRCKKKPLAAWAKKAATYKTNVILKCIYNRGRRDVMKKLYRYPFAYRRPLYDAVCIHGEYAFQLLDTFPALAALIWATPQARGSDLRDELETMVLEGARLKEIANKAEIPWSLRRLPPQLTNRCNSPHLMAEIWQKARPNKLYLARACRELVNQTFDKRWPGAPARPPIAPEYVGGSESFGTPFASAPAEPAEKIEFILWAARHMEERYNYWEERPTIHGAAMFFSDMMDWAADREWRTPWNPKMSLSRARQLSQEWHQEARERRTEEIAEAIEPVLVFDDDDDPPPQRAKSYKFPDPWIEKWEIKKHTDGKHYHVIPLDKGYKVTDEGRRMQNCVGTYKSSVERGSCYIYSVRVGNKRLKSVVTIELKKLQKEHDDYDYYISQARGKCNLSFDGAIEAVVKKWCEENRVARRFSDTEPQFETSYSTVSYTGTAASGTGTAWLTMDDSSTTTLNITGEPHPWQAATTTTTTGTL